MSCLHFMSQYALKEVINMMLDSNFTQVYRIEAVASLLHAMSLSEDLVGETPNLNQGLCLLGEILDDVAKELDDKERKQ